MKRDLDKIRDIMLYLEENLKPYSYVDASEINLYEIENNDSFLCLVEHINLLEEDNYIEVKGKTFGGNCSIFRITSKGHDFIDTFRNDTIWNKVKEKTIIAGGYTLSFLVEAGVEYIKRELLK